MESLNFVTKKLLLHQFLVNLHNTWPPTPCSLSNPHRLKLHNTRGLENKKGCMSETLNLYAMQTKNRHEYGSILSLKSQRSSQRVTHPKLKKQGH